MKNNENNVLEFEVTVNAMRSGAFACDYELRITLFYSKL